MSEDDNLSVNSGSSADSEKKGKKRKKKKLVCPHVNDIVSGRGSGSNRHEGNLHFRKLIRENKQLYLSRCKNEKMFVARDIFDSIGSLDPPGRFLQKNPETGTWFEIGKDRALEKISQALREKNSKQHHRHMPPLQAPTVPLGHIDQTHTHFAPYAAGLNRAPNVSSPNRLVTTGSGIYDNAIPGQTRVQPTGNISDRMAYLAHELRQADERLGNHDGTSLGGQMLSREAELRRQQVHHHQQPLQQRNMPAGNNFDYPGDFRREQNAPPVVPKPSWYYNSTVPMPPIPDVSRFQSQTRQQSHFMYNQMHPFATRFIERGEEHLQRQKYFGAFGPNIPTPGTNMNTNIHLPSIPGNSFASISTPSQQRPPNIPFVTPEQFAQQQRLAVQQSYPNDGLAIVDNSSQTYDRKERSKKKKKKKGKKKRSRSEDVQAEKSSKKSKDTSENNSPSGSQCSVNTLNALSPMGPKKEEDPKEQPRDDCNVRGSSDERSDGEKIVAKTQSTDSCATGSNSNAEGKESPTIGGLEALSRAASLYRR